LLTTSGQQISIGPTTRAAGAKESAMRFNQFSYYPVTNQQALQELSELGFKLDLSASHKEQFEAFVRICFFNFKN